LAPKTRQTSVRASAAALPHQGLLGRIEAYPMTDATPNATEVPRISDNPKTNARVFSALYADLRRIADRELRRFPSASVSPTTLVHEAYLNLMNRDGVSFDQPGKCLSYVARAMRGMLIDFARRHQAIKRGSGFQIVELNTHVGDMLADDEPLVRLSDALDWLANHNAELAELVDLKYFCGFSFAEIAKLRSISERTVQRDWQKVRLLLYGHINEPVI
jgi:RNA polymerase sigma factor (TIGR02999 family)